MKVIVAGSRGITDYDTVKDAIERATQNVEVTEIVSGTARGVDQLGERWATENTKIIAKFPAWWKKYGKRAGYLRNADMAEYADALVAIWDGRSRGTKHMIDLAREKGLKVYVHLV